MLLEHGLPAGFDADGNSVMDPFPTGFVSSADLLERWLKVPVGQQNVAHGDQLKRAMRALGYDPKRFRGHRGWVPPGWSAVDEAPDIDVQPAPARVVDELFPP